ncbi:MAG: hypothetical protein KGI06_04675 [Candidatus Micrarchaeota archaeon]|nr:hypothetical protein [Candidatus Micrarchaeota archaeon]
MVTNIDLIRPKNNKIYKRVRPMTVCLSVICDSGTYPRIVFCADRQVTAGGLTFEQARAKFALASRKCTNCVILNAGDGYNADKILVRVGDFLDGEISKGRIFTIMEISELIRKETEHLRNERINAQILNPRGLNLETFYKNLKKYPETFWKNVDEEIKKYSVDTNFLVVGFDIMENGKKYLAHINLINENGEIEILDGDGFGIIGMGNLMSLPEITKEAYQLTTPLSEAIVKVYWAKKSAERVLTVGHKSTDLGVMWCISDKDGNVIVQGTMLQPEFLKELDKSYEASNQKMHESIVEIEKNIEDIFAGKKTLSIH